jgi:hypothetical protein
MPVQRTSHCCSSIPSVALKLHGQATPCKQSEISRCPYDNVMLTLAHMLGVVPKRLPAVSHIVYVHIAFFLGFKLFFEPLLVCSGNDFLQPQRF